MNLYQRMYANRRVVRRYIPNGFVKLKANSEKRAEYLMDLHINQEEMLRNWSEEVWRRHHRYEINQIIEEEEISANATDELITLSLSTMRWLMDRVDTGLLPKYLEVAVFKAYDIVQEVESKLNPKGISVDTIWVRLSRLRKQG